MYVSRNLLLRSIIFHYSCIIAVVNSVECILYVFLCINVVLSYTVDPDNAPHVGVNAWARGTGGRDTAGLGGKGGPYHLDAGHRVYQVSNAEKDAVPVEVSGCLQTVNEWGAANL